MATSSNTGPVIQCNSDGSCTPTNHMAYIQQKFGGGGLSEADKDLLLASWRSKTFKLYDSHFKKCCTEWGLDPVSGPISDVTNFLADLHAQGYHTHSLNCHIQCAWQSGWHGCGQAPTCGQDPERNLPCQATSPMLQYYLGCPGSIKLHLRMWWHQEFII